MDPFFTVIVATHYRPRLLARALESLARQTMEDFEVVVVASEGSADTRHVAAHHARPTDSFIAAPRLKGPSETRNLGIAIARGHHVVFLDDDDTFDAGFLEGARQAVDAGGEDIVYFDYTVVEEERGEGVLELRRNRVSLREFEAELEILVSNFIPMNAFCVPAHVSREVLFDPHLPSHEDWDFLIGASRRARLRWSGMDGPNVHRSQAASRNAQSILTQGFALDFLSIYRKWPCVDERLRAKRQELLRRYGLSIPVQYF